MGCAFFRAVAGRQSVWGVRDEGGAWEALAVHGRSARLFFSSRTRAEQSIARYGVGRRLQAVGIPWPEFRDVVLPALHNEGSAVLADPMQGLESTALAPGTVRQQIELEIDRRGDLPRVMDWDEVLGRFGFEPKDSDLPEVRALLRAEAEAERRELERGRDTALLLCVLLFRRGQAEDSMRVWEAKGSGFDLGCYLDLELTLGAGIEATEAFLAAHGSREASELLAAIRGWREQNADFGPFDPPARLAHYRQYFGGEGV